MKIFKLVLIKQYQLTNWVRPLFNCIMWHSWIREGRNRSILNGRSLYWASSIFITAKNPKYYGELHGALLIMPCLFASATTKLMFRAFFWCIVCFCTINGSFRILKKAIENVFLTNCSNENELLSSTVQFLVKNFSVTNTLMLSIGHLKLWREQIDLHYKMHDRPMITFKNHCKYL